MHADFSYDFLGVGFDIEIPIVPDGFLPASAPMQDELAIVPGFDLLFLDDWDRDADRDGVAFAPQVSVQWNLYFERSDWSIFPELGFAMFFLTDEYEYYRGDGDVGGRRVFADAIVAFGARYHFTERNALTLKAGWPFGFQVGVTF